MRRALVVRHIEYEGLAGFSKPLSDAGYAIETVDVTDPRFGSIDFLAPDLLILMGGPMAIYESDQHDWMSNEIARLRERLNQDLPTLGVCLGAQMVAAALEAQITPGPSREVGFATVELTDAGLASPLRILQGVPVLHWHGDAFTVPVGASLLAYTRYAPQAFSHGQALALQCHLEMGDPADPIAAWCDDHAYLAGAGTSPDLIERDYIEKGPAAIATGRIILSAWLASLKAIR